MSRMTKENKKIFSVEYMEQVGNAMTANYGDETDDGVCEHDDWDLDYEMVVREDGSTDTLDGNVIHFNVIYPSQEEIQCAIRCTSCGAEGWLAAKLSEHEVEWTA